MIEAWVLWVLLVGLAAGGVVTWLLMVRLPRAEDDVSPTERPAEAAWISAVIERYGGVAPPSLVEEVLDLHQAYLRDPRLARPPMAPMRRDQAGLPPPPPAAGPGGSPFSQPPAGPPPARR